MDKADYITMGGASYLEAYVLSFASEKEFISKHLNELNFGTEKERKTLLKSIYKAAKK